MQYGPRITAIALYLYVGQFLSKKRTATALTELFGTPLSEDSIATMTTRAAEGLGEFLNQVKDRGGGPIGKRVGDANDICGIRAMSDFFNA